MLPLNISKFPKVIVANLESGKIEAVKLKNTETVPLPYIALSSDKGETWFNKMTLADAAEQLSTPLFATAYKEKNEATMTRCKTCCCKVKHEDRTKSTTSLAVELELLKRHTFEENGHRLPKTCKDCFWTFDPEKSLVFSLKALDEKVLGNYKLLIPTLEFVSEKKLRHAVVRSTVDAIRGFLLSRFANGGNQRQTNDEHKCEDEDEKDLGGFSTQGRLKTAFFDSGVRHFHNDDVDDKAWSLLYENAITEEDREFVLECYWIWGKKNRPVAEKKDKSMILLFKNTVFHCCEEGSDRLWSDGKGSFLVTRGSKVLGLWSHGDATGWIGEWLLEARPIHLGSHCSCQFEKKAATEVRCKEKLSSVKARLLSDLDSIPLFDEWVKLCYNNKGDFIMRVMERKKSERGGFFDSFSCY